MSVAEPHPAAPAARWPLAVSGLALFVFAVVALSGPGRVDIVDGQTRFESGKNLVEHGDTALRDPRVTWSRFPGRDGLDFSYYRFPQTGVAAAAIVIADATGPATEGRRHFVFVLHGAVCCGLLAVLYAVYFRRAGLTPRAAAGWAAAGIFCTPSWYYGTSTFDDILGATAVVAAVVVAARAGADRGCARVAAAGLLLGLAVNCKQPLGVFLLPAVAAADNPARPRAARLFRAAVLVAGVGLGGVGYVAYDRCKFPADTKAAHGPLLEKYAPNFFGNPAEALLDFAVGPASGAVWYFPPVLLCAAGLAGRWAAGDRRLVGSVVLAAAVFAGFLSLMTIYKGDVAWGPRYLTPVFAVLWLFAPAGAERLGGARTGLLLAAGVLVQVLGLSIDPHRLYVRRAAPSAFYLDSPWHHFDLGMSHLLNRPREIREAWAGGPAPEFTPAPAPTFAPPVIDLPYLPETGPGAVGRWQIWRGFRPWWASFSHLPPDERPVDLGPTAALLGLLAGGGAGIAFAGLKGRE